MTELIQGLTVERWESEELGSVSPSDLDLKKEMMSMMIAVTAGTPN
jgi:hypothetical protein